MIFAAPGILVVGLGWTGLTGSVVEINETGLTGVSMAERVKCGVDDAKS